MAFSSSRRRPVRAPDDREAAGRSAQRDDVSVDGRETLPADEPTRDASSGARAGSRQAVVGAAVAQVAQWSLRLLLIAAATVGALYLLGELWVVVLPALLALLLSTVLWPMARALRRALPAAAAAAVALIGGLIPLGLLGAVMYSVVSSQAEEISDAVVQALEDAQNWTSGPPLNLADDDLGDVIDRGTDELQERAQEVAGYTLSGVSAVGSLLLTLVLTLVLTFFFIKDGPRFLPWLARWLPARGARHASELATRVWNVLGGFIRAQAGVGLVDAVGIGVGLAILGVPLALPLAVLTFFGAFIPIVGAVITGLLAVLVALVTEGPTTALIVAALVLLVQQVESNLLQPLLMGRTLALHPALVILAVTAGGTIWGVAGAFLAVPALAAVTAVARYVKEQVGAGHAEPDDGQDAEDGVVEDADDGDVSDEREDPDEARV